MAQLSLNALTKSWGAAPAVNNVSFVVPEGQLVAVLGPSGCGKSTILRLIAGLEEPTSGTIEIAGRDVTRLSPSERRISMVFQSYALFPHLSVAENIVFGLKVRNVGRAERDERLKKVAAIVELTPYLERKPSQLSGGQRQRVALARALAIEPLMLLLDEPFGALDAKVRKDLRQWLRALHDETKLTTIMVTHDQEEALALADRVAVMNEGRIEQVGRPRELIEKPASAFVREFLGTDGEGI